MKNILYLIITLFISFNLVSCEKEEDIGGWSTDDNYIKVYNKNLTGYSSELAYTIVPDGDNYKVYNKYLTGYSSELAYTIIFPK
ncbi:MAG: hypothetical protein LBS20_21855 [Prevotella sp.]|nr:hypothetical protein [Prevotella sp.]